MPDNDINPIPIGLPGNEGLVDPSVARKFHAERMSCIGGSDAHHLMGADPFGCARWLFYNKAGFPPDFPFDGNRHTRRGVLLESVAADEFSRITSRALRPGRFRRLKGRPYLGAHTDSEQHDADRSHAAWGLLEVKVPTFRAWRYIGQNGIGAHYHYQLQWGMLVSGFDFGSLWAWNPEQVQGYHFEEEFDRGLGDEFVTRAERFWSEVLAARDADQATVQNPYKGPENPYDRRCRGCEYRWRCRGFGASTVANEEELLEVNRVQFQNAAGLDELAYQWSELKAEHLALGKRVAEVECVIRAQLGDLDDGQGLAGAGGARAFFNVHVRNTAARLATSTTVRRLRVIPPLAGPIEAPE